MHAQLVIPAMSQASCSQAPWSDLCLGDDRRPSAALGRQSSELPRAGFNFTPTMAGYERFPVRSPSGALATRVGGKDEDRPSHFWFHASSEIRRVLAARLQELGIENRVA